MKRIVNDRKRVSGHCASARLDVISRIEHVYRLFPDKQLGGTPFEDTPKKTKKEMKDEIALFVDAHCKKMQ
jgi:hypothetical protein